MSDKVLKVDAAMQVPRLALRAREAAESLGICERTLWTWTQKGLIPHLRQGGTVLYPVESLRRWMQEQVQPGAQVDGAMLATVPATHGGDGPRLAG